MPRTVKARCAAAAVVMLVPAVVVPAATTAPPAIGATSATSSTTTEQIQFLANHQLADGAILGPGNSINPYFANLAAIGLARANDPTGNSVVSKWMQWYLGHLNTTDAHGFKDTIYDYTYDPATGAEQSTGSYDSVDSYAATALSVASVGYLTGNSRIRALVGSNILTYEAIANLDDYPAPTGVRQPDGLTLAVAGGAAYTMDNSEVAAGLADFARLESLLGRSSQSGYYQSWSNTSVQAITKTTGNGGLWNASTNAWDWALGSSSNPAKTFYPDAAAQLWPTLFGVVAPGSSQAAAAWRAFTGAYPSWYTDAIPDAYPWTSMARAGQLMGDSAHANTLLTTLENKYAPSWGGNWYDDEAGWFVLAATATSP